MDTTVDTPKESADFAQSGVVATMSASTEADNETQATASLQSQKEFQTALIQAEILKCQKIVEAWESVVLPEEDEMTKAAQNKLVTLVQQIIDESTVQKIPESLIASYKAVVADYIEIIRGKIRSLDVSDNEVVDSVNKCVKALEVVAQANTIDKLKNMLASLGANSADEKNADEVLPEHSQDNVTVSA